jgi:iron complex transport system ATP-binding protein
MIAVSELTIGHGRTMVVSDISFDLRPGELVAVIGPSGAGKSTLLATLAGDLTPRRGSITLSGRMLRSWRPEERAQRLAVLPQDSSVAFAFTALEVVLLGRSATVSPLITDVSLAREAMRSTGVGHLAERQYQTLSGGERQRVQLARVMAQLWGSPGVLLLDEPTSSLDVASQHVAMEAVIGFVRQGGSAIATIHDLNLAAQYADRVLVLGQGRQLAFGPTVEVLSEETLSAAFSWRISVLRDAATRPIVHAGRAEVVISSGR